MTKETKDTKVRSQEEVDLLEMSTKKTKTDLTGMDLDLVDLVKDSLQTDEPNDDQDVQPKLTFKETLMGGAGMREGFINVDDESFISDDEEMCEEEKEEDCPTIRLSKMEKARLRSPWRQTLIVKVLGRTVGYAYLLRRIKALWHPKSLIDLVAIDNDYFLVKFASKDDYNFAKFEGP